MDVVFASLLAGVPVKKHKAAKHDGRAGSQPLNAGLASQPAQAITEDDGPARKKQKKTSDSTDPADTAGISLFGRSAAPDDAGAELMGQAAPPQVQTHDATEEAAVLRKAYRIRVSGGLACAPLHDFQELQRRFGAGPRLLENLQQHGFLVPTPVQRQAIPTMMEGHQLLAIAPTGSGKTLAFLLPIIIKLRALRRQAAASGNAITTETAAANTPTQIANKKKTSASGHDNSGSVNGHTTSKAKGGLTSGQKKEKYRDGPGEVNGQGAANGHATEHATVTGGANELTQWPDAVKAIVLSPTHELAGQQFRVLQRLLPGSGVKACLLTAAAAAGTNFSKVDVLVANPMRLEKLIEKGRVNCKQVRFLVLDEADKLFELGFLPQIDSILAACTHPDLTRALFSATLPDTVEQLARSVMHDPVRVTVGERNSAASSVLQQLHFVGREAGKMVALRQLISSGLHPPVLVFVSSKDKAHKLHQELMYDGVHVDSIHSDQPQAIRNAAVDNFRSGSTWLLVATDLVGRGMDFIGVNTVVNYDFPRSTTDYIHRIGRTGRGGRVGEAITFYTEDDSPYLRSIANVMKASGAAVPEWMLQLPRTKDKRGKQTQRQQYDGAGQNGTIGATDSKGDARKNKKQKRVHTQVEKKPEAPHAAGETKQKVRMAKLGKLMKRKNLGSGQRGPGKQVGRAPGQPAVSHT